MRSLNRLLAVFAALAGLLIAGLPAHAAVATAKKVKAVHTSHVVAVATKRKTAKAKPRRSVPARPSVVEKASGHPALKSNSVLVVDEADSSILISKRPDVAVPIASITKLMTALVVLDAAQSMDEMIEVAKLDLEREKGATSRLLPGTLLSRGDLMHLALMSSENRAAHALGSNYPGGLTAFVQAMNAKATELGMTNSRFVEPTGLSDQNMASPEDLTKLVRAASKRPTIQEYSTDKSYTVAVGRRMVEFRNTDSLVSNPGWNIIVQKTGYIAEAGRCLVMKAVIEGRSVVIVLLDSFGKYTRVADAQRVKAWIEATLSERPAATTASNQ